MTKRLQTRPKPPEFPGTESAWYYHLLSMELGSFGDTPHLEPIFGPDAYEKNVEELFAKSRSKQLADYIIKHKPEVARRVLKIARPD